MSLYACISERWTDRCIPGGCPLGLLGGRRSGLGNLRSGGTANTLKLGWAGLSAPPSQRVLQAWQEMTLFLQQFVENNLGKSWCLVYSQLLSLILMVYSCASFLCTRLIRFATCRTRTILP